MAEKKLSKTARASTRGKVTLKAWHVAIDSGKIVARVSIDGRAPIKAVLDTGASVSVFRKDAVTQSAADVTVAGGLSNLPTVQYVISESFPVTSDVLNQSLNVITFQAAGTVLLFPGRTEYLEKYGPAAQELAARGFATLTIDWRGQGLSGREVADPVKGHFHSFDDPVNDLATALKLLSARLPRPHIGLAHSMGGCIACFCKRLNKFLVSVCNVTIVS